MTTTSSARKTSGWSRDFIIPPPGNSQRPGFMFVIIIALGCLIGAGYLMYALGSSRAFTISILLVITAYFTFGLAFMVWIARSEVPKREKFEEAGDWASWTVSQEEYRRYASSERAALAARLVQGLFPVAMVGIFFLVSGEKHVGVLVSLIAPAAIILAPALVGPPRISRDRLCEVRVNGYGMLVAGRFTPFRGGYPRLRRVDFQPGDPGVLVFTLKWAGSPEPWPTRVPVPQGHWDDAIELAHDINVRFRAIKT